MRAITDKKGRAGRPEERAQLITHAHVPACDSPNAERSAVSFFSRDSRRAKRMSCTGEPPLSPFMCPLSALSSVLAIDL